MMFSIDKIPAHSQALPKRSSDFVLRSSLRPCWLSLLRQLEKSFGTHKATARLTASTR